MEQHSQEFIKVPPGAPSLDPKPGRKNGDPGREGEKNGGTQGDVTPSSLQVTL